MLVELRAFKFIDDRIVVVGKAEQIQDHGVPCWLCSTLPPLKQNHAVVGYGHEARVWLKENTEAEEIFSGGVHE